jgi:hypothetical protein
MGSGRGSARHSRSSVTRWQSTVAQAGMPRKHWWRHCPGLVTNTRRLDSPSSATRPGSADGMAMMSAGQAASVRSTEGELTAVVLEVLGRVPIDI